MHAGGIISRLKLDFILFFSVKKFPKFKKIMDENRGNHFLIPVKPR